MMQKRTRKFLPQFFMSTLLILLLSSAVSAQEILSDKTGDGVVSVLAFGDSITYGVGDGTEIGDFVADVPVTDGSLGYPPRLAGLLGVPVANDGIPGEEIIGQGDQRFPGALGSSNADLVVIFEGINDTIERKSTDEYNSALQKMINVAVALGREPVLTTLITPCCNHAGREPFSDSYSAETRRLATLNRLALIDLDRAWKSTCVDKAKCELFNLPDGLHPNSTGYDVIAQTAAATILGVDIFAPTSAVELESQLGLPPGTIIVKPEV